MEENISKHKSRHHRSSLPTFAMGKTLGYMSILLIYLFISLLIIYRVFALATIKTSLKKGTIVLLLPRA